jgi:hypothetical protein
MSDPVYTGVIQDKGGAVYNLRSFPGQNDTERIQNAIAAVPDGGTLFIPTGIFTITQPLVINRPISIEGSGSGSVIWLNLQDNTRTGVVIGNPAGDSLAENQTYRNFSVMGAPGSCRFGLGVYYCHRSRFENVHVRPGSTEHAVVVGGCLLTHFNFVVQNNSTDGYPAGSGTWGGAGVLVVDLRALLSVPGAMPTNACVFDCIVEGGTGGGLAMQPQDQGGGNNYITGTYEGFTYTSGTVYGTGYALYIDGCLGFDLYDLHVEETINGSLIKNCGSFSVRQSGFFSWSDANKQPQLERLRIENSANFTVDRVTVGELRIEPTCSRYEASNIVGIKSRNSQPRKQDSFLVMVDDTSQGGVVASTGMAPFTSENLVANGDLSRWPLGFSYMGVMPTLVRTGSGAGDPARRFNLYAAKVTGGAGAGGNNPWATRATLAIGVPNSTQYAQQPVTIWADIQRVSGEEISLGVYDTVAGFRLLAHVASTETEWVRVALTYYPLATMQGSVLTPVPWHIIIAPLGDQAYTYYLGGVGALVGVAAPMGVQSPAPSLQSGVQLMGKRIEYGSGAPTAGEWQQGDIMFNEVPTAGGSVGWVCTGTGAPGTWKTFGAISA